MATTPLTIVPTDLSTRESFIEKVEILIEEKYFIFVPSTWWDNSSKDEETYLKCRITGFKSGFKWSKCKAAEKRRRGLGCVIVRTKIKSFWISSSCL